MPFVPEGYKLSESRGSYFTVTDKIKRVRILSSATIGWIDWDKTGPKPKPVRTKEQQDPLNPGDKINQPKEFWALVVYDYETEKLAIWEITQQTLKARLLELYNDTEDWGDPTGYDIKVSKTGKDKDTKYTLNPGTKSEWSEGLCELRKNSSINMEALFDGDDPFTTDPKF